MIDQKLEEQLVRARIEGTLARRASGVIYALCPFHTEKTPPSLLYGPSTRRWFCFGCRREGVLADDVPSPLPGQLAFPWF